MLVKTNPNIDYEALERQIEQRSKKAIGVGQPGAGVISHANRVQARPLGLRLISRLVASRLMREELARYPRLYRVLRRLYQNVRALA